MTTAFRALPLAPRPGLSGFVRRLGAAAARLRHARSRRRVLEDLLDLDDHLLADIGLSRGQVEASLAAPWNADPATRLGRFARLRR